MKTLKAQIIDTAGGELTDEKKADIRAQLDAAVDALPAAEQASAKGAVDAFLRSLDGGSIQEISARSIIMALGQTLELLKALPRGVQALAQTMEAPPHIYVLGGVEENITTTIAVLEAARGSLSGILACACFKSTEPVPPKEGLS